MIVLFTDFGAVDPYVGQLHGVLGRLAPGMPIIDLLHNVPAFDVRAGAYLLPAFAAEFPSGTVFVCVIDPDVGTSRDPVMLLADGRWYVGPDNGLFTLLARRAAATDCRVIYWRPPRLSASFHGRDLFAPVAAQLARGQIPESGPAALTTPAGAWPDDWPHVIYVDHFGNAMTGLRAATVPPSRRLHVRGRHLDHARVFADVPPGTVFWYENSIGLVEIAANRTSAAQLLGLRLGDALDVVP
jgi:S-adenosylmethionine hydrolase